MSPRGSGVILQSPETGEADDVSFVFGPRQPGIEGNKLSLAAPHLETGDEISDFYRQSQNLSPRSQFFMQKARVGQTLLMGQLNLQDEQAALAVRIVEKLRECGHAALLVGGCVRDLLLHRVPDDYDVATSARPEEIMQLFPRTVGVGAKFGVVLVTEDNAQVEVATFRTETGYCDRRRPDHVEFSDAKHDAMRRDFTINALFMDPATGELSDWTGGQDDLQSKTIRTVGDAKERFSEDALRLLRAVRFASSLGFTVEPRTWDALRECAGLITAISAERIRDELIRGFTRPNPGLFLDLLDASGLLRIVLPEVSDLKGCEQPPEFHPEGDVYVHTRLMLDLMRPDPSAALAFSVLLHDIGKPATAEVSDRIRFNNHQKVGAEIAEAIGRRLAFPNELREKVVRMVQRHMDFMNLTRMKESTLRRFLTEPTIEEEIELHRVDCLGSHGDTENCEVASAKLEEIRTESGGVALPSPLVNGYDLIALGLRPGPAFKQILRAVQDAQLEGQVTTREEALVRLSELASPWLEQQGP